MKKKEKPLHNWTNENRELIRKYMDNYIAFNETGVVAFAKTLKSLRTKADKLKVRYIVYYVSPSMDEVRILPIRFKVFKTHDWQPMHTVTLTSSKKSIELEMLVDSGADCSLISYQTGLDLGLKIYPDEGLLNAKGIGAMLNL